MKICRVVIPFIDKVTGEFHKENDKIHLSDERIAEIRTVNPNMVFVIGEVPEEPIPEVSVKEETVPEETAKEETTEKSKSAKKKKTE